MKLKIIVGISILLFFTLSISTLTAYLIKTDNQKNIPLLQTSLEQIPTTSPSPNPKIETMTPSPFVNTEVNNKLTISNVAFHNSITDCWIIISNNVYNVTDYIKKHEGGMEMILNFCGRDATQAFKTKSGEDNNHSTKAYNMLNGYLLGALEN